MNPTLIWIFLAIVFILFLAAWIMESSIPIFAAIILLMFIGISMSATGIERPNTYRNETISTTNFTEITENTIYTQEKNDYTLWGGIIICFIGIAIFLSAYFES